MESLLTTNEIERIQLNSFRWEIGQTRKAFIRKLVRNHGHEIITDLNTLITNPYYTLQDIANRHDITRERIRQIVRCLYGRPYTYFRTIKCNQKKEDRKKCSLHPINRESYKRGGKSEAEAFRFLRSIGYDVKPSPVTTYDMVVNDYKVDVKSVSRSRAVNKKGFARYYGFGVTKQQMLLCDYFILHALDKNKWFVYPNVINKSRINGQTSFHIFIRDGENTRRSYNPNSMCNPSLHENNWQILKRPN